MSDTRLRDVVIEAACRLQVITDRLSAACRKDLPHDHQLLRELRVVAKVLDDAFVVSEPRTQ